MLNRSAINMGKANEHGARLEFQCHCSVVRPMLVLGQAQQPSSDAAWTAAAWSGAGKAMGAHHGGQTRLVARGRRGNMLPVMFELQPTRLIWDTYDGNGSVSTLFKC